MWLKEIEILLINKVINIKVFITYFIDLTTILLENEYSVGNKDNLNEIMAIRGKNNSSVQDNIKRSNTGVAGNRHLQPRQNPLIGYSPRTTTKAESSDLNKFLMYG